MKGDQDQMTKREELENRIRALELGKARTLIKFDELIDRARNALELLPPGDDGGAGDPSPVELPAPEL